MSVPPPPQGGNPFGQQGGQPYAQPGPPQGGPPPQGGYGYPGPPQGGQPPHGQPQPGQQPPYGQPPHGQQPYPGQPPYQGQQQYGQPGPPPKKSPWKKIKTIATVIVAVVGLSLAAYSFFDKDDAKDVAVGDCLKNAGSDTDPDIKKLDCSDSDATHKVLKKADNTSSHLTCNSVEGWNGMAYTQKKSGDSFVLCLGPAK